MTFGCAASAAPRSTATAAAGALLAIALLTPASAATAYSGYRIPAHRALSWTANLSGGLSRYDNRLLGSGARNESGSGRAGSALTWFADRDSSRTFVTSTVDATYGAADQRQSSTGVYGATTDADRRRSGFEGWTLTLAHRHYRGDSPLGLEVSATGSGRYEQTRSHRVRQWPDEVVTPVPLRRDDNRDNRWAFYYDASAALRFGIGRVRDATPVFTARVMEDRLLESGVLARPLSPGARERLAAIMTLDEGYGLVRDRPSKDGWREIDRLLREDGALRDGALPPAAVLEAGEPIAPGRRSSRIATPVSPVLRLTGMFVGPSLAHRHFHQITRGGRRVESQLVRNDTLIASYAYDQGYRTAYGRDRMMAGVAGEWHRARGAGWQFDASGLAEFPLEHPSDGVHTQSSASVTAIAADRWMASVYGRHTRVQGLDADFPERDPYMPWLSGDGWSTEIGATLDVFLEDRLSFRVGASDRQTMNVRGGESFQRDRTVQFSLTYRLAGSLEAPGTIEPLRSVR